MERKKSSLHLNSMPRTHQFCEKSLNNFKTVVSEVSPFVFWVTLYTMFQIFKKSKKYTTFFV